MSKGSNTRKNRFIRNISRIALEDPDHDIASRCKFNFSYFDHSQQYAEDISTWDENNLQILFNKLKYFSCNSLHYWLQQRVGSHRHHVLEIYGAFPHKSEFTHPCHVPSDVDWARFRLDGTKRLIGFTIPKHLCLHNDSFDCNTFYVVFLDLHHKFYLR